MSEDYESSTVDADGIRDLAARTAASIAGIHAGDRTRGWVLGMVVDEGARDTRNGDWSWEAGSIYVLRADGTLVCADFRASGPAVPLVVDVVASLENPLTPMLDWHLSAMDRPNFADYEIVERDASGVRFELGRNFQVRVQRRGDALIEALMQVCGEPRSLDNVEYQRRSADVARRKRWDRPLSIIGPMVLLLVLAIPVWALTPVVAYVIAFVFPGVYPTFFWAGRNREGDLYPLLAVLLPTMIVSLGVLGLVFPYRDGEEVISPAGIAGFAGGFVLLLYQAFAQTGGQFSWYWPPMFAVVAHLGLGIVRKIRDT
ncbi:hypothetical protein ACFVJ5_30680 [Nocardia sp. NPDC127606]|uniref:hypothetical protein n=1 Tax=Nocardia sp. NPDC127606 TaxID=3345406 RepID=UPI00362DAB06